MWRACDVKIAKSGIFLVAMFAGGARFAAELRADSGMAVTPRRFPPPRVSHYHILLGQPLGYPVARYRHLLLF
jgi:hypothetical protein